jgi:hypothetical protein
MLIDAEGQLRWASASDQTAQTVENQQERLAQGPCAVAFSQRLSATIRNIHTEPDWAEFAQVLVGEGICAALSVPVELDGGVIGTLDIYAGQPRDRDPSADRAGQRGRHEPRAAGCPGRLRAAAGGRRSSTRRLAGVARDVTAGQPLPVNRRKLARARAGQAKDGQAGT